MLTATLPLWLPSPLPTLLPSHMSMRILLPRSTITRRSQPKNMCMRKLLLSLTFILRLLPRSMSTRRSQPKSMSMSRSRPNPTFTRSPSLSLPPSSPLLPLLLTLPLPPWLLPPLLTTTPQLLPQLLLTIMLLLPQLLITTTTTSDTLPLPTPRLLPRLPKRCHTTFDDEDIQRRYLRQAVINCDKRIS